MVASLAFNLKETGSNLLEILIILPFFTFQITGNLKNNLLDDLSPPDPMLLPFLPPAHHPAPQLFTLQTFDYFRIREHLYTLGCSYFLKQFWPYIMLCQIVVGPQFQNFMSFCCLFP